MTKISPCLWFDGQAEEAANFYASVIPNSHVDAVHIPPRQTSLSQSSSSEHDSPSCLGSFSTASAIANAKQPDENNGTTRNIRSIAAVSRGTPPLGCIARATISACNAS